MYRTVPKHQKIIVARSIISAVGKQNPPGRFLERDKGSKLWYEVPFERAVEKAKQALRERGKVGEGQGQDNDDEYSNDNDGDDAAGGGSEDDSHVGERRAVAMTGKGTARAAGGAAAAAAAAAGHQMIGLSPSEEVVATRFRNMLRFKVDPTVVESKMKTEGISARIISSVLLTGAGGGGGGGGGVPPQPPPAAVLEHHVQFAKGTNAAAAAAIGSAQPQHHTSMGMFSPKRRVSSVLLNMFGFGDSGSSDGAGASTVGSSTVIGRGTSSGASALPPEVREVIDGIVPEGDVEGAQRGISAGTSSTGGNAAMASAAAASYAAPTSASASAIQGAPMSPPPGRRPARRRSSIFNLFRRGSRSVAGGGLTFGQRACTSIKYDSEIHQRLLVELGEHADSDDNGDGPVAAASATTATMTTAAGQKRKASEIANQRTRSSSRQQQQQRGKTMAEAAALAAAEVSLEELEPEDPSAPPKRMSFSPALFGKMFSAFGGQQDEVGNDADGAGNRVETAQEADSAPSSPGLFRQSTAAARRSFLATVNLFSSVAGPEESSSSVQDEEEDSIEPQLKRRRRSTWLSGLRFSTMVPAVAEASSTAAAAEAVRNMGLVDDDHEDSPTPKRLRSLGKGTRNGDK